MPQEPWNAEEDELLYQLVQRLGPSSWSETARLLNSTLNVNRLAKQCRERWISHVDPRIRRGDWSLSEDRFILNQQHLWGNRWADIARHLPGRTTHAVKNRYHQLQRLLNQGKTKLETILNAPLIHVVPHFLQQTNSKEGSGKNVVLGLHQRVKKSINRKKRENLHNPESFGEIGSTEKMKNNIYSIDGNDNTRDKLENKTVCSEIKEKVNLETEINLFENLRQNSNNTIYNQNIFNQGSHSIGSVLRLSKETSNFSPGNQNRTSLELQQSPGVLLTSDIGIYPVTPTIVLSNETCKISNVNEPSTCETKLDNEYISKTEYSTPSSITNENFSPRRIQNMCSLNEESHIYSGMSYREPNWYGWNEDSTTWDNNPLQRLDTGSITDPFLHSFPEI